LRPPHDMLRTSIERNARMLVEIKPIFELLACRAQRSMHELAGPDRRGRHSMPCFLARLVFSHVCMCMHVHGLAARRLRTREGRKAFGVCCRGA
jgi:hypothetical protein